MPAKRVLFLSPLDRRVVANTREQNMAEAFAAMGWDTLSLTLAQNTSRALSDIVRDSLSWRVHTAAHQRLLCIDPPLNPCTGLHTNLAQSASTPPSTSTSPQSAPRRSIPSLKSRVVGLLTPLGILRDVVIIPAFLLHALREGRFDLCIAYGPWAACVAWLLRACGRTAIYVYDDQDFEPAIMRNPWRQRWAAFLERTMMQRADRVVSVGHRLAALRRSQTGRAVSVIPNGVTLEGYPAPMRPTPSPADTTSPRATTLKLVYVGNVVPWSGLDEMLRGLPSLIRQGYALQVNLLGDGLPAYVQELHQLVQQLDLSAQVHFVGKVPNTDIHRWLAEADVGLAHFRPEPYRRYAFPLKVVEYMRAGLAVIGTRDTETEDILRTHQIGVAVTFAAPDIAEAIARLANDRTLLATLQHNAREAVAQYAWSALAAQELALATEAMSPAAQNTLRA